MNRQDEIYFEALSNDREESADMLEKPSMRGIKNSVVEKYSDQAHFIYELLQNADDAKATTARFVLEPNRLFLHIMVPDTFRFPIPQRKRRILHLDIWGILTQ